MSLWFTLRVLGTERTGQLIDHAMDLVELIQLRLTMMEDWEVITSAALGILTFRYKPWQRREREDELERLNEKISKVLLDTNTAAIITVKVNGVLALRICFSNVWLTEHDIEELVESMDVVAKGVDESMD